MLEAEEIATQGELITWAESYISGKKTRNRALFATLYLTGARVNEILYRLKKHQITLMTYNNLPYALFRHVYTEKNPNHPLRNIPTPLSYEYEKMFFKYINVYLKDLKPKEVLFKMTGQRAWQIISSCIMKFKKRSKHKFWNGCHYLRKARSTHLVELYGFSEYWLYRYHAWTSIAPGGAYIHLKFKDLMSKFEGKE